MGTRLERIRRAEVRLPTVDFEAELRFLVEQLGFRLDRIWPADDPAFASLSGHGAAVLLERSTEPAPVGIRLLVTDPEAFGEAGFTSPGGLRIAVEAADPPLIVPAARREFVACRAGDSGWRAGRAGMLYRDLVPGRLGGALTASHIRVPGGGPVPDSVHYHAVAFQLIFCHRGWVRVVYEDQGPPFVLNEGDCLIQPPEIRHRVLEASEGLEVIEVSVPADHVTTMDHEMKLPTPHARPEREFEGTRFLLHREAEARWEAGRIPGFEMRETGIGEAAKGVAGVRVLRRAPAGPTLETRHRADILFGFVRRGSATLRVGSAPGVSLETGDAFVLPPGLPAAFRDFRGDASSGSDPSGAFEMLEVGLPAAFETQIG